MSFLSGIGDFLTGSQGSYYQPSAYNNKAGNSLSDGSAYTNAANAATSNPYLSGMLGPNGTMQQAQNQATQLQNTGFSLQPQDYSAYGQAAGNIARDTGAQESGLANSLSSRGFGNAASGTAGAQFSGLAGNKNEQLAQAQTGIANARMSFAQNALNSTRQAIAQMAGVGNQATGQALGATEAGANSYNQGYNMQNQYGLQSALNQQEQKSGGLFGALESGFTSGIGQLGTTLGSAGTSLMGGGGGGSSSGGTDKSLNSNGSVKQGPTQSGGNLGSLAGAFV